MKKSFDFKDDPTKIPPPQPLDPAHLWDIISKNNLQAFPLLLQTYRIYAEKGQLPSQNPSKKIRKQISSEDNELILAGKGTYDYLYHQEWPLFKATKKPEEDQFTIKGAEIPKEGTKQFWQFMERRLMASVFSEWGFRVESYQHILTNQTYTVDQNRLRQIIQDILKEMIKIFQDQLSNEAVLPSVALVALTSRLLRCDSWLPVWAVTLLKNAIQMRYWLGGSPVKKTEAIQFMKKCSQVVSSSKHYCLQYRVQELTRYEIPVRESREEDRPIVTCYLQFFDLEQVEKKTGVNQDEVKQRIREVLRGSLRKVTCLMELIGVQRSQRVRNIRELQLIAGPRYRQIQGVLLSFFLEPSKMDTSGIYSFYKLLLEARNLYHLDQLQAKTPLLRKIEIRKKDQQKEGELRRLYNRYLTLSKQEVSESAQDQSYSLSLDMSMSKMEQQSNK